MEFTVNLDQAKEWMASFANKLPTMPPWLTTVMTFLQSIKGRKKIQITIRVVDD